MKNIFNNILIINILLLAKTQSNQALLLSFTSPKSIKSFRASQKVLVAKQAPKRR